MEARGEPNQSLEGLKLTRIAAEKALMHYRLGSGKSTDILALSFSSFDAEGHKFGPNSPEMEKMTYAIDREISELLNTIQQKVPGGLKSTVVVLTGDHGVAPVPQWAQSNRMEAGTVNEDELANKISARLTEKYGKPNGKKWVLVPMGFNIYLNHKVIQEKNLSASEVEEEAKSVLKSDPRIAYVVTSSNISARVLPPGIHENQVLHSYYPGRSGDLMLLFKPFYIPKALDGSTANHITGYSYDRTVPIIFTGFNIKAQAHPAGARVIDIAPTLSYLAGVLPPSLSEGRVLSEIFK
jgi:predicted AlkP superfamily pyrophosphatase or phosphodiesterase